MGEHEFFDFAFPTNFNRGVESAGNFCRMCSSFVEFSG